VAVNGLNQFMTKIGARGGMSYSTNFDVEFSFKDSPTFYDFKGENKNVIQMLCDEAQLPNVQSAVSQRSGRNLGEGPVSYPHTRIFTDISLGFLLDADLTALKFINNWYNYIFGEGNVEYSGLNGATTATPLLDNRINRLKYLDQYAATLRIMKTEPNATSERGRVPVTYLLEKCYPYSIDTVPLAYGSSQVSRLTVNFYYSRHTVAYGK
jgi:hypothetical protein